MKTRRQRRTLLGLLLVISLLAGGLVFYTTRWGAIVYSDAAVYFRAGQNIALGRGYVIDSPEGRLPALTQQVPVYPLLLSLFSLVHIDPVAGARWLDIFLVVLTVWISGWIFLRWSSSPIVSVPVALLVIGLPAMIFQFSTAGTEAPFLLLALAALILLFAYLQTGERWALVGSAICAGIAPVTRYSGVFLPPLGSLLLLVFLPAPLLKRLLKAISYGLSTSLPFVLWILWSASRPGTDIPIRVPDIGRFWEYIGPLRASFFDVLWTWVPYHQYLPQLAYNTQKILFPSLICLWVLLVGISIWKLYHGRTSAWLKDPDFQVAAIFGIGSGIFLFVFIFSYLIDWDRPDVSSRTLSVLYLFLTLGFFASLVLVLKTWLPGRPRLAGLAAVGIGAVMLAGYLPPAWSVVQKLHLDGEGYTSREWRASETIQAVKRLRQDTLMISSDTGAILFWVGKPALEINELYEPKSITGYIRYGDDSRDNSEILFRQRKAVLVVFEPDFYWQLDKVYADQAQARMDSLIAGLEVIGQYQDGTIYMYPEE